MVEISREPEFVRIAATRPVSTASLVVLPTTQVQVDVVAPTGWQEGDTSDADDGWEEFLYELWAYSVVLETMGPKLRYSYVARVSATRAVVSVTDGREEATYQVDLPPEVGFPDSIASAYHTGLREGVIR